MKDPPGMLSGDLADNKLENNFQIVCCEKEEI
jgi:hypothetical protein